MLSHESVRPAAVAGMFYPGDAPSLRAELARCLHSMAAAPGSHSRGTLKALIVPHAGYAYSGTTAAAAFAALAGQATAITRVVLLGPTHRVAVQGVGVPTCRAFATPLGTVPLDRTLIDKLASLPQIVASDAAHALEHSLEVQLPFLQSVLGAFELVPLAVGNATVAEVAEVINAVWGGPETLVVVSSDLSHYHSYAEARQRDAATVSHILHLQALESFDQACGALPINGLLHAARAHGLDIECLAQCNSGDTAGDKGRVVGYAAFGLYQPNRPAGAAGLGTTLLGIARAAIARRLGPSVAGSATVVATAAQAPFGQRQLADPATEFVSELSAPGATFVTLTLDGQLRGCIGSLEARRPLGEDVEANAVAAAFHDPRFAPVSAGEWPRVRVEVSLLARPEPMPITSEADALRQLRPGVDGVILVAAGRRATFLPQVWEQLPAPADFLVHLKQKAGLSPDHWSSDTQLFRYTVQKWKE